MVTMVRLQEKASSPRPSKHRQETGGRRFCVNHGLNRCCVLASDGETRLELLSHDVDSGQLAFCQGAVSPSEGFASLTPNGWGASNVRAIACLL
jgi:hypothetical protein